MKKIIFIWSGVTHEGTIISVNPLGSYQIIEIEDVKVNNAPAAYLTFSIMVNKVEVGQHGPVTIVSMETVLFTPVKMI